MIKTVSAIALLGILAAVGATKPQHPAPDDILVGPDGIPLVVHYAAASLPPARVALACQKSTDCGTAYHRATWFTPAGTWEPRPWHTNRAHECHPDADGINNCESAHTETCDSHQHEDGGDFATIFSALVTADPSELAAMVAANPALSLTPDGLALQLRSPCAEDDIAAYLPLMAVAQ